MHKPDEGSAPLDWRLEVGPKENKAFVGSDAGPWCELLERVTRVPKPDLAGICQALIEEILLSKAQLCAEQLALVGLSARRVLDMAWQAQRRNGQMIIHALRTVCTTFASDRAESAIRIRLALSPDRVRKFGHEELHWLGYEVGCLIPGRPRTRG